jgi:hypothetical protein
MVHYQEEQPERQRQHVDPNIPAAGDMKHDLK